VFAGFELFLAQYLQLGLGLSPLVAGAWTVPAAGGLVAGSLLAPHAHPGAGAALGDRRWVRCGRGRGSGCSR
jgi:DHA2 family multidrug resistance protein-like MFS transporter